MITIKLDHPTDPRYLMLPDGLELPDRITAEEAFDGKYGKLMLIPATEDVITYKASIDRDDWTKP